jgi:hypothetical protein
MHALNLEVPPPAEELPPIAAYAEDAAALGASAKVTPLRGVRSAAASVLESDVMGALLKFDEAVVEARAAGLTAEDFCNNELRQVYQARARLEIEEKPHSVPAIADHLDSSGAHIAGGWLAFLGPLVRETLLKPEQIAAHVKALRYRAIMRRLGAADEAAVDRIKCDLADLDSLGNPRQQRPRSKPIDWLAWQNRTPPAREWWIQDWLSPAPTLCSGTGGIGKSLLWQTIGTSLAMGREFLAPTTRPLRVLLWMCEDDENEIVRRQDAICAHFGIERTELAGRLHVEPRLGYDNTLIDVAFGKPTFTPTFLELREQVNDLAVDVLVLDNIGQIYGCSENDRHQVTVFVSGLQGIVRGRLFAPVLLGHVSRAQGSEFSGSAAWENTSRMRWYMGTSLPDQKPDEDEPVETDIVYLAKRKANYTERDYRRLTYQRGLLLPESIGGPRFDAGHRNDLAERIVLKALLKLKEAGIYATDGKSSPDYLPKQILEKCYAEGHNKKELTAAMNRLIGTGKLKRDVVGEYGNRTPRKGLVPVATP